MREAVNGHVEAFAHARGDEGTGQGGIDIDFDSDVTREVTAAAAQQRDVGVLASWYARRAREMDARGGQLRHAVTLCELGVARVLHGQAEDVWAGEEGSATDTLLRSRDSLRHLSSLVQEQTAVQIFSHVSSLAVQRHSTRDPRSLSHDERAML